MFWKNKEKRTGEITATWADIKHNTREASYRREYMLLRSVGETSFQYISNQYVGNDVRCAYCKQWGEPRTACQYCGAPID